MEDIRTINVRTISGRREIEKSMDAVVEYDRVWLFSVVNDCFEYIAELEERVMTGLALLDKKVK